MSVERRTLTAARSEILENGVGGLSLERVAERAGVTVSELQRCFDSPAAVRVAVCEEVARELNGAAIAAARSGSQDRFDPILTGSRRLFELYVADGAGRHILHAARQQMTLAEWNHLDRRFGVAALAGGLRPLADQGLIPHHRVEELAVMVYGLVTEACVSSADGLVSLTGEALAANVSAILEAAALDRRDR